MTLPGWKNKLYFGDNLEVLRRHIDPKITEVYFHNLDRVRAGAERCIRF